MDKIQVITKENLDGIILQKRFEPGLLVKDYYLTILLYLLKDIKGIYFKGGTALNKIFLNHTRLSEDLDFTIDTKLSVAKQEITNKIKSSGMFGGISLGKEVDGFARLVVSYNSELGKGEIFIDLNTRARLRLPAEMHELRHFYDGFVPKFSLKTLSQQEMIAEKVEAAIGRNKPRDHYDIYKIIQAGLPIDLGLVRKKCEDSGCEFDMIKMFSNAKKLKNRWDMDMSALLREDVQFSEVMKTLASYFGLKEEKERKKSESLDSGKKRPDK